MDLESRHEMPQVITIGYRVTRSIDTDFKVTFDIEYTEEYKMSKECQ